MISSFIDTFINLDEPNKKKLINIVSKFINPIKIYLMLIILLLIIICVSNYYLFIQFKKLMQIDKLT